MKTKLLPHTTIGKWSTVLNSTFIIILGFNIFTFDSRWWDLAVGVAVPLVVTSFVTGIMAFRKNDHAMMVYVSIAVGACSILFLLLHSVFISD